MMICSWRGGVLNLRLQAWNYRRSQGIRSSVGLPFLIEILGKLCSWLWWSSLLLKSIVPSKGENDSITIFVSKQYCLFNIFRSCVCVCVFESLCFQGHFKVELSWLLHLSFLYLCLCSNDFSRENKKKGFVSVCLWIILKARQGASRHRNIQLEFAKWLLMKRNSVMLLNMIILQFHD